MKQQKSWAIMFLGLALPYVAWTYTAVNWNGTVDNDLNTAGNWSDGAVPDTNDLARIYLNGDTFGLTTSDDLSVAQLLLSNTAGHTGGELTFDLGASHFLSVKDKIQILTSNATVRLSSGTLQCGSMYYCDGTAYRDNWFWVDGKDAAITNSSLNFQWGINNTFILTNGATFAKGNVYVGRNQMASNSLFIASGANLLNLTNGIHFGYAAPFCRTEIRNGTVWNGYRSGVVGEDPLNVNIGTKPTATNCTLIIDNSVLTNMAGYFMLIATNTTVHIDNGSDVSFTNYNVDVGQCGSGCLLTLSGGSRLNCKTLLLADNPTVESNQVSITGTETAFVGDGITCGQHGDNNRVEIGDGASVKIFLMTCSAGYTSRIQSGNIIRIHSGSTADVLSDVFIGSDIGKAGTSVWNRVEVNGASLFANRISVGGKSSSGASNYAPSNTLLITDGGLVVCTNTCGIGYRGDGNVLRIEAGGSLTVSNGASILIGCDVNAQNSLLSMNESTLQAKGLRIGVNGNSCKAAITNSSVYSDKFWLGNALSSSNDSVVLVSSRLSVADTAYLGDNGCGSSFELINSHCDVNGAFNMGYQASATQTLFRISGTNSVLTTKELALRNSSQLEFDISAKGYDTVPIWVTNSMSIAADTHLTVDANAFANAGGGIVVLVTNTVNSIYYSGGMLTNIDLSAGASLIQNSRYIAVHVPSRAGTIVTLGGN